MRRGNEDGSRLALDRGGLVEEIVFGTRDVAEIDSLVNDLCVTELGSGVSEVLFRATSVGVVVGVILDDARRVVVKTHQPRETRARLQAVHEVQTALFEAGLPCPQPLVGPVALVNGHAVAETLIDAGEFRDTHDSVCRRLIAEALAWHLAVAGSLESPEGLTGGWNLYERHRLWPLHAHAPVFDFEATNAGAEWIDELAARAKAAIHRTGRRIAGHTDWSGKHFRFSDEAIAAIYDWDSLAIRTEAEIVGNAAITFTTNFDLPGVRRAPTPDEMDAFIDEYSAARGTPLSAAEHQQVAACALLLAAYTARCEHCALDGYDADDDPDSFTTALRVHGSSYLSV